MASEKSKKKKTIEGRVADTLLQRPMEIEVAGRKWQVAPPSVATLVLASEAISRFPEADTEGRNVLEASLSTAKDCGSIGEIVAILILGAKAIREWEDRHPEPRRRGLFRRRAEVSPKDALARELMEGCTPSELNALAGEVLKRMEIADFFGLTTFLRGVNLTKRTKVEQTSGTTASGR